MSGNSHIAVAVAIVVLAAACSSPPSSALTDVETAPVLENYAAILHAAYSDAADGALELREATRPLSESTPTAEALVAARAAWTAARLPYMETEVARFYGGPIDDEANNYEGLINSWPMDEAYVDYVVGPGGTILDGGLINTPSALPTVDTTSIAALNQADGEESVATGWHAIEFLLWGQDLSAVTAGARPFTDFVITGGSAMNAERRRAYLAAVTELLVGDLDAVRDAWAPGASNYRAEFVDLPANEGLRRILFGMGSLAGGELAGERINVAYTTQEQEDEHSCFSDTTLNDHLHDAIGIRNVYVGRYTRVDGTEVSGPSLSDLVRARDAELDTRTRSALDGAVASLRAIPGPFDQAILGTDGAPGRVAIARARQDLRALTSTLVEIADLFGITLNLE